MNAFFDTESIKTIINEQLYAVLSSTADEQPYCDLVAFTMLNDLRSFLFATEIKSQKYQNITLNNRVCLLIDNRSNRKSDISESIAISVFGVARREGRKNVFKKHLLSKNPQLKAFVENPGVSLVIIESEKIILSALNFKKEILPK